MLHLECLESGRTGLRKLNLNERSVHKYVIIGGGIAGVTCAQEMVRILQDQRVTLISAKETLAESKCVLEVTERLKEVIVFEKLFDRFESENPLIDVRIGEVSSLDFASRMIFMNDGSFVSFQKLIICTGARPKIIFRHPNVIGLRDTDTVENFHARLKGKARKIAILGNGGIALELVNALTFCEVHWIIKNDYIGNAFFDASASAFILPSLLAEREQRMDVSNPNHAEITKMPASDSQSANPSKQWSQNDQAAGGHSLGPLWLHESKLKDFINNAQTSEYQNGRLNVLRIEIHFEQEVVAISSDGKIWTSAGDAQDCSATSRNSIIDNSFPLWLKLSNDEIIGCDFLVSATGVCAANNFLPSSYRSQDGIKEDCLTSLELDDSGFIIVDRLLRTSVSNVFAAGDCCAYPSKPQNTFFQMRLWTQARLMGLLAAHSALDVVEEYGLDMQFDMFAHLTRFFGHKVVMLGRYNAQGLGTKVEGITREMIVTKDGLQIGEPTKHYLADIAPATSSSSPLPLSPNSRPRLEILVRVTPGVEYVKVTVLNGRVVGALLIGDTQLEEVMENLILNRLDVSVFGIGLLDPNVDIGDFFD